MKRFVIALVIAASWLLPATTTYADRQDRIAVRGNFFVLAWQDTSVRQRGHDTVIDSSYTEAITGDVTGTDTGHQTAIVHPDGRQTVSGIDYFDCELNGTAFTAVVRFRASGDTDFLFGTFEIVDGHESGVTGHGTFSVDLATGVIEYEGVVDLQRS